MLWAVGISTKFRSDMTELGLLRNVEALLDATPNSGLYRGDFAEHNELIYPTDLDGIVEIKGEFLVHEYKKVGAPTKPGQGRLLESLRTDKGFCIITIYHIGPCWDMNFERAIFKTPGNMPMKEDGTTEMMVDVKVMERIKLFHDWWTKQVLRRQQ